MAVSFTSLPDWEKKQLRKASTMDEAEGRETSEEDGEREQKEREASERNGRNGKETRNQSFEANGQNRVWTSNPSRHRPMFDSFSCSAASFNAEGFPLFSDHRDFNHISSHLKSRFTTSRPKKNCAESSLQNPEDSNQGNVCVFATSDR